MNLMLSEYCVVMLTPPSLLDCQKATRSPCCEQIASSVPGLNTFHSMGQQGLYFSMKSHHLPPPLPSIHPLPWGEALELEVYRRFCQSRQKEGPGMLFCKHPLLLIFSYCRLIRHVLGWKWVWDYGRTLSHQAILSTISFPLQHYTLDSETASHSRKSYTTWQSISLLLLK